MDNLINSINVVLSETNVQRDKIGNIVQAFKTLKTNTKLKEKTLSEDGSIRCILKS